ncbi:hypothetical protein [Streptomyces sp. enrichment culture]|uniref:hypothetical protein n=1 Tax=Streptomyces sp. enrichment culture TaxID=1795815 RepID=UPI003F577B22
MATLRVGAGRTEPGQGWKVYGSEGIYIDVDTSDAHFSGDPVYTTSLSSTGGTQLWAVGGSSVYDPGAQSFRVYLRWVDDGKRNGKQLTPETAEQYGYFINWIGVDTP